MTARPQDLVHVGARISFPDNGRSPEQVVTLSAAIALTLAGGTVEQWASPDGTSSPRRPDD